MNWAVYILSFPGHFAASTPLGYHDEGSLDPIDEKPQIMMDI